MKKPIAIGDKVQCKAGNMGLMCVGTVWKIKPAFAHYPALLSIEGTLNYSSLKWSGEAYEDKVSRL